jgi:hypothetical protein
MRGSSPNAPSAAPSVEKTSSLPNPSPFAPDALVTSSFMSPFLSPCRVIIAARAAP